MAKPSPKFAGIKNSFPWGTVLPAQARLRCRSGADAPHRRTAPGTPIHGCVDAASSVAADRRAGGTGDATGSIWWPGVQLDAAEDLN